ncbi:hypothetical protein AtEden1_Chr1g0049221 [Arabidopsis thaliana]
MNRTRKDEMNITDDSNKRRNYNKQARDKRLKYMKQAREKRLQYIKQARKNGSKVNRTSKDGMKIAEDFDKRRKYMKRVRENNESHMGQCHTQVHSDNNDEDDNLSIAQFLRLNKKKYSDVRNSGRDASEPLGKISRVEADNNDLGTFQKLASIRDEIVPPSEIAHRNGETDEAGSRAGTNMDESPFDENNSSEPPFCADRGVVDIVVSPPETRQACDDELDVNESNADMFDDGSKQPKCLLHEDGIIAVEEPSSDEKLCSSEAEKEDVVADDDTMNNIEPVPHQHHATRGTNRDETSRACKSVVLSPTDESNIQIAVGEGSQGQDCGLQDNGLGSDETSKSNEQLEDLEKRKNDFGEGDAANDSYEKRLEELKVLALSLKEHITMAQRNLASLKERSAMRQRKIEAARWI